METTAAAAGRGGSAQQWRWIRGELRCATGRGWSGAGGSSCHAHQGVWGRCIGSSEPGGTKSMCTASAGLWALAVSGVALEKSHLVNNWKHKLFAGVKDGAFATAGASLPAPAAYSWSITSFPSCQYPLLYDTFDSAVLGKKKIHTWHPSKSYL